MPPNYVAPPAKLRRVFIEIRCRGCGQKGHNRATCDRQNNETQEVNASSAQMEQGSSSQPGYTTVRGRGISRVTRGNGEGGLPSSKLNAIRGRGLGIGITGGRGLPSSRPTVATRSRQGGPDLDNISHDNNMASK
ncbi:uncharacterized protein Pyn_04246 [Prunus yedoensis var. nudiflora]|uniref:CCHC-type domain-containing protein n=1 Tax=Prunus yedoensis var. nudiflora TaxID=2094558 RepID=A0A314ZX35_PRUYE|nr:uncharacterized protein Pyn_04246 [Prunus yedoensis var. nudiflora]